MVLLLAAILAAPGAVVLKPVANLYSGPAETRDVVSQALYGTGIQLIEEQDGWARVRTPDDYTGWMPAASFRKLPEGAAPYASRGKVARVEALFANLYREPDVTKHQPVLTVPYETYLEIVPAPGGAERWLQALLVDGSSAWVQRGDLSFDLAPASIPDVIAFSKRFLGLPYLWGGTSAFGYDCSGFTQMLCRRRGVRMPRDAGPQAHWEGMLKVEKAALQPGDLLYFGSSEQKITHTGMFIGGGEFIHATTHERPVIQVSRLEDPYWTGLFVAARRPK